MGNASSLSGGRILNCFPHPVARSAARTVAGPILKNEGAEVWGLRHGVAGRKIRPSGSHRFALQGVGLCTRYTATGSAQLPRCSAHSHGERILFIWGPNFAMLRAPHRGGEYISSLRSFGKLHPNAVSATLEVYRWFEKKDFPRAFQDDMRICYPCPVYGRTHGS
jgi:hypothetical protein